MSGFGRLERSTVAGSARPFAEINMTPLIDVMLVLLVIFIVAAPLLVSRLPLELPRAAGTPGGDAPAVVALAVDGEGRLYLNDREVDRDAVVEAVRAAARRDPGAEVQLRADRRVPYGRVAQVIGWVQQSGLSRIGFVTDATQRP